MFPAPRARPGRGRGPAGRSEGPGGGGSQGRQRHRGRCPLPGGSREAAGNFPGSGVPLAHAQWPRGRGAAGLSSPQRQRRGDTIRICSALQPCCGAPPPSHAESAVQGSPQEGPLPAASPGSCSFADLHPRVCLFFCGWEDRWLHSGCCRPSRLSLPSQAPSWGSELSPQSRGQVGKRVCLCLEHRRGVQVAAPGLSWVGAVTARAVPHAWLPCSLTPRFLVRQVKYSFQQNNPTTVTLLALPLFKPNRKALRSGASTDAIRKQGHSPASGSTALSSCTAGCGDAKSNKHAVSEQGPQSLAGAAAWKRQG